MQKIIITAFIAFLTLQAFAQNDLSNTTSSPSIKHIPKYSVSPFITR